jgi:signal transduction histidine kinase
VSVIDDGRGIDVGPAEPGVATGHAGVGLGSMRRRAALLGATLTVGPGPQAIGTEVRLEVGG